MVPVGVGHEKMVHPAALRTVRPDHLSTETAQARTHIAEHIVTTALDLDTGRIPPKTVPRGEIQRIIDKAIQLGFIFKPAAGGRPQGLF